MYDKETEIQKKIIANLNQKISVLELKYETMAKENKYN